MNADDETIRALCQRRDLYAVYATKEHDLPTAEHTFLLTLRGITKDADVLVSPQQLEKFSPLFQKNLLAAIALCDGKIGRDELREALDTLTPLPHRAQLISIHNGVRYVDSSADTTPSRTVASLSEIQGDIILLAGGRTKGVSYEPLLPHLSKIRHAVLYGENREEIAGAIRSRCPYTLTPVLSDAVCVAKGIARAGETILLSPMSTSHDQYTDYRERAADFRATIARITSQEKEIET